MMLTNATELRPEIKENKALLAEFEKDLLCILGDAARDMRRSEWHSLPLEGNQLWTEREADRKAERMKKALEQAKKKKSKKSKKKAPKKTK
jgi:hypothetical protein